ncbi:hypothetical protein IQ230_15830 [Gloeocapsopsis crepidinum LEGE 06123]|uniref:Uncharacterized protein n=1 Tax=Gloeocapsopsis crepidinum LEGE 06123 TaxID=588587 RepID=A0ABR9UU43_9CHRO|nr:hypothetical protein [Gloeocapsopsis crepidinum]MBE9191792.1 hypothetical protein [Gloeocapsopsis crepidinum LEGE 06123]
MSSASGRYQSKLFNFIHQQSRRFTEQCDRAFRQIQFATSWIAPAVLYPFYALFQSTRKLKFSPKPASPQLQAPQQDSSPQTPSTDTPIQQVLQLFETPTEEITRPQQDEQPQSNIFAWFSPRIIHLAQQTKELFHPNPQDTTASPVEWIPVAAKLKNNRRVIRGIATELTNRNLVLVTTENEILNVFTPQQQEQLQATIEGEVATYWRCQRLAYASQMPTQLNGKTSPGNLLIDATPLNLLDRVFAEIESHSFALTQHWQSQLNSTTILADTANQNNIESDNSTSQTLRIQALIWAAIDFFFGSSSNTKIGKNTPVKSLQFSRKTQPERIPFRPVSQLPGVSSPTIEDPWLSLSDLFGEVESEAQVQETVSTQIPNKVLPENKTSDFLRRKLINGWQRFKPKINVVTALVKVRRTNAIAQNTVSNAIATETPEPSPTTNPAQINPTSEWIDVSAIAVGYVKHPLEQVLEWLDRAMLWLEKLLFKFWQWLKRFDKLTRSN